MALHHHLRDEVAAEVSRAASKTNAHAELSQKTQLLETLWQTVDPLNMLLVGQTVLRATYDPIWKVALEAPDPDRLIEGWQRFEKFAHSNNRVRLGRLDDREIQCERYALVGPSPRRPENHLICGILTALLENTGLRGLTCSASDSNGRSRVIYREGRFLDIVNRSKFDLDSWFFQWTDRIPKPPMVAPGNRTYPDLPFALGAPGPARQAVYRTADAILSDISRPWKLSGLAGELAVSPRSLQRRLTEAGLSFSTLVRLLRIAEASKLLREDDISINAIGFCTGFSDNSHFARDFRTSTGMRPSDFRDGTKQVSEATSDPY